MKALTSARPANLCVLNVHQCRRTDDNRKTLTGAVHCAVYREFMRDLWAYHYQARIDFSRPGKPTDNCHIETFNGSFRDECLNLHWFETLEEAKVIIEAWRRDYNESRPHSTLNDLSPAEFARRAGLSSLAPV